MVRFLLLVILGITLAYSDIKLLYGFLAALVYCIVWEMIDNKKEDGDC